MLRLVSQGSVLSCLAHDASLMRDLASLCASDQVHGRACSVAARQDGATFSAWPPHASISMQAIHRSPEPATHQVHAPGHWSGPHNAASSTHQVRASHTQALQHANQSAKPAKYTPWTFSRFLQRPRPITKRMGFLMQTLEEEQVQASLAAKGIPDFRSGDILEVRVLVPEAGRKEYIMRGLCIGRYNKGIRSAFKIYNVYAESGGVVQHIPLHMPDLLGVRVVGHIPVARNKLYYLLDPSGRYETHEYQFQAEPQPVVAAGDAAPAAKPAEKGKKAASGAKKAGK